MLDLLGDGRQAPVHVLDGLQSFSFNLQISATEKVDTVQTVFGDLTLHKDEILVPISSSGTVVRHDIQGKFLGQIGQFGALPGNLNFPTCVEVSSLDTRWVSHLRDTRSSMINTFAPQRMKCVVS